MREIQTDTTALKPAMSQKTEVGQICLNIVTSYDRNEIKLTQNEDLLEQKGFKWSMTLPNPTKVMRHVPYIKNL